MSVTFRQKLVKLNTVFQLCRLETYSGVRDFNQVNHLVDHAPYRRRIDHFHGMTDASEAQATHALTVFFQRTNSALDLGYFYFFVCHGTTRVLFAIRSVITLKTC